MEFTCNLRNLPDSLRSEIQTDIEKTPAGHLVLSRNEDSETIRVNGPDNNDMLVFLVSHQDEELDRYAVLVNGNVYTNDLRAPKLHREFSEDALADAADAAIAFAQADGVFLR
jgi:hypothetical protein